MTKFSELGLSPETVQTVIQGGYDSPTPIQEQAIPVALAGRDVLGIAQTGTGKTAAFTLPMIDKLAAGRAKARMPRSLVIEPTRELADQVGLAFEKYATGRGLSWALLIGGVSMDEQVKKLDRGVDVLIATPGRLLDLFGRGKVLLTGVQIMVVDEADRMLDMGFIPDIEEIFKKTPPGKQTLFFSATMPPEITRLTKQFLKDPTRIEVARPATTADTIAQHIVRIGTSNPETKRAALRALIGRADVKNGIVFCNRKTEVDVVAKSLKQHGFDAAPIHGDLDQSLRTRTLESFRNGSLRLLVASDVAARGLDIPDVSHVFNFDVPYHADDYVHRIGRTGRAGKKGDTFMLVTPADEKNVDKVTKLIGLHPDEVTLDLAAVSSGRERAPREERPHEERPREDRPKRAESRGRSRGARSSAAPEQAPAEAAPVAIAVPQAEAPPPPRARPERARTAEPSRRRSPEPEREHDAQVTGFGSDLPAFMR
ncbi:MAG TPA: DEAD/DEAH box helicase [Caulobacteraceae bacterium]|jgi:superfamily II DNA/RNA helicase